MRTDAAGGTPALPRRPLAWGMQQWGPLPGTTGMYLLWDGPGSGLFLVCGDGHHKPIEHPTANGVYNTVKAAGAAAQSFAAAGDETG